MKNKSKSSRKIANRIAGAIVDLAYRKDKNPKIAVEVLIGHGICHIICETNVILVESEIKLDLLVENQDINLANNQLEKIKCGDNGIFKGVPLSQEEKKISKYARCIYNKYPYDGKYILDKNKFINCQSHAQIRDIKNIYPNAIINPL